MCVGIYIDMCVCVFNLFKSIARTFPLETGILNISIVVFWWSLSSFWIYWWYQHCCLEECAYSSWIQKSVAGWDYFFATNAWHELSSGWAACSRSRCWWIKAPPTDLIGWSLSFKQHSRAFTLFSLWEYPRSFRQGPIVVLCLVRNSWPKSRYNTVKKSFTFSQREMIQGQSPVFQTSENPKLDWPGT